jgi:DUF177 domain-containing protein
MLTGPLPEQVNHRKLVDDRAVLQGTIPLRRFSRLADMLENDAGSVRIRLEFRKQRKQRSLVAGKASLMATLICQACLEPVEISLEIGIRVILVSTQAELLDLKQSEDGLVVEDRLVGLVDLFEDELIVNLPMVPRHSFEACEMITDRPAIVDAGETHRPFAVLSKEQEDTN